MNRLLKKLDQKKYRPFKILKTIGQEVFQLKLPEGWIIHDMFNEDLLTQCKEPHYKDQHMEPALPSDIINEEEEYEVEEIRKHQKKRWETQYVVHWKDYRNEHDQWITKIGLPHTKEAIEDYWIRILSQNL